MTNHFSQAGLGFVLEEEEEHLRRRDYIGYMQYRIIEPNGKRHWVFLAVRFEDWDRNGSFCYIRKSDYSEERVHTNKRGRILIDSRHYGYNDWTQ